MSRGLGPLQHRICDVLDATDDLELPLRELRRRLGEPNRSNLRRAIRGLLERGILEESSSGGEPRVVLTAWSLSKPSDQPDYSRDAPALFAREREREPAVVKDGPEAVRRGPRGRTGRSQRWVRYEHRFVRNRALGEMQRRVLGVLQQSTEPGEDGLPVTVVKELVGADRSNARRAIRTLLMRGLIEEAEDGSRIRLSLMGVLARALSP